MKKYKTDEGRFGIFEDGEKLIVSFEGEEVLAHNRGGKGLVVAFGAIEGECDLSDAERTPFGTANALPFFLFPVAGGEGYKLWAARDEKTGELVPHIEIVANPSEEASAGPHM